MQKGNDCGREFGSSILRTPKRFTLLESVKERPVFRLQCFSSERFDVV